MSPDCFVTLVPGPNHLVLRADKVRRRAWRCPRHLTSANASTADT